MRLNGGGNATAQSDCIQSRSFAKALEDSHLSGQHIPFVNRGDGALGFVFNTFHGIADKNACSVDHDFIRGFAFGRSGFLRTE